MSGVAILPPGVGLLIPDVTVNLRTEFHGYAWAYCDASCCPNACLYMGTDLLLEGEARLDSVPPLAAGFTAIIPVVSRLPDRYDPNQLCAKPEPCDTDLSRCAIYTTWSYTEKNFQVTLSLPVVGKVLSLPLADSSGVGLVSCQAYVGCEDYETYPVLVSWPQEVVVPIGGEAHFAVVATMFTTSHPILPVVGAPPYDRPLHYQLSPSGYPGVSLTITDDRKENGKIIPGGQGTIRVEEGAPIPDGATETIIITVIDRATGKMDRRSMTVRYVRNHPPKAIDGSLTISHWEYGCFGPVRYKAYDPDLPENFGFDLCFVSLGFPKGWSCDFSSYLLPFSPGCLQPRCQGKTCEFSFSCLYERCSWPNFPIPHGTYEFPFSVVEYKRGAINPKEPEDYGFADAGKWTLVVNNQPPKVTVEPAEIRLVPGQSVSALVGAEDPDGDRITLGMTSGPGSFPTVSGVGKAWGTWRWTVPSFIRSYSAYASFVAKDPCGGVGYGFLYLRTVNPPQAHDAHAIVSRGGSSEAYAYVEDPDSPWVSVSVGSVPPGLSVHASVEDDPFAPGLGGFMVVFRVAADPTLCEGVYTIPFTVTDPDGLSSSATLHVRVVGNRPPVASPPVMRGETTVVFTPEGVVRTPVVFQRIEVWDPDGDPVTIEGYGIPPTYAANLSAFLGSLWALSTPGGLTDEDLC